MQFKKKKSWRKIKEVRILKQTFVQHFILTKHYFICSLESNPVSHPEAIFSLLDNVAAEMLFIM